MLGSSCTVRVFNEETGASFRVICYGWSLVEAVTIWEAGPRFIPALFARLASRGILCNGRGPWTVADVGEERVDYQRPHTPRERVRIKEEVE
jgi:hypothetical protein